MNSGNFEAFILKLNLNMEFVYFRTFQGASTFASVGAMFADSVTSGLYAHVRTAAAAGGADMRIVNLAYLSPGDLRWQSYIYNPSYAYYPKGKGSLTNDATQVYSCQVNQAEAYIFKVDIATGALTALRELRATNAIDCDIVLHSPSNKLILAIHYIHDSGGAEGITEVAKIDSATMSLDTTSDKMKMSMSTFMPRGSGRMF